MASLGGGGGEKPTAPLPTPPPVGGMTALVVAAEADGVGPSVLVTVGGGRQYLFGCAEVRCAN